MASDDEGMSERERAIEIVRLEERAAYGLQTAVEIMLVRLLRMAMPADVFRQVYHPLNDASREFDRLREEATRLRSVGMAIAARERSTSPAPPPVGRAAE